MTKFSIVEIGSGKQEIKYFVEELRRSNLISGTEKDENGDTVYHTHNFVAVKKLANEYDHLMVDAYKD